MGNKQFNIITKSNCLFFLFFIFRKKDGFILKTQKSSATFFNLNRRHDKKRLEAKILNHNM